MAAEVKVPEEVSNLIKPEGDAPITNPKRKAALVVVSLGADRASQIYKYLNEEDIEELTYEVAKLGKTSNTQVESTLDEFYKLCLTHKMMTDGGLDYARNVLEKAFGESTARNLLEKVSKTLQSKPFNFFMKGDPKALLSLLQNERPQVIALIMAYMEAEQAAQVLEQLPVWELDAIHTALIDLAARLEVKNGTLLWPVRIAAAGTLVTPGGAMEILTLLGREEALRRLKLGLEKLV